MAMRLSADTGGTHTDLVLVDDRTGDVVTMKVPTTPEDLGRGVLAGIAQITARAGAALSDVGQLVYGTTLVTNLIVEERASRIGLITTAGFRDVLGIGRAVRKPNVYDIHWRPPTPLVPRELRLGVPERMRHDGTVLEPLDEAAAAQALDTLVAASVESIAVCLLNSYANPAHEKRIGQIARDRHPGLVVSLSCDVVREFREFERTTTTVLNAFVTTPIVRHLDMLAATLAADGLAGKPYIIRGNGGVMSFAAAKKLPAAITHSGPMGGIIGSAAIARACGLAQVITLDMGGTSADISLIAGGVPAMTTRSFVGAHPLLLPMLDLVTIGAGGGSLAAVDAGGALRVGPRSAGARPGPACYAAGGTAPTVTDANLVAGRLNADYFLDGARALRPDRAEAALRDDVAAPLNLSVARAALGIIAIVEAHMANGIRRISVDRGVDPRGFTLIGFGGAGPLHAARLAEALGMTDVLIPPAPGNASAQGMLLADIRHDFVRTRIQLLDAIDSAALRQDVAGLLEDAAAALREDGVPQAARQLILTADLRYQGQNHHLTLPVPLDIEAGLGALASRFNAQHRQVYGYDLPGQKLQLVNLRLAAIGAGTPVTASAPAQAVAPATPHGTRTVLDDVAEKIACPVYRFANLAPGHGFAGPALVEYPGSTLFVPAHWHATYDTSMNARLHHG